MEHQPAPRADRRVGELARATGLTVRTLHYYEQIGLLVPSGRSASGHRLYDQADVARLYRICLLRRLGLPLAEIGQALDDPAWSMSAAINRHLRELDRRAEATNRLRSRLAGLAATPGENRLIEELLTTIEEMTMLDTTIQSRITLLVYEDIAAAHDWLVRVFGLGPGQVDRDPQGNAVHGELRAGDGVVWLHPQQDDYGLRSPAALGATTASVAVMVDDVDGHFRRAAQEGATIIDEPIDRPYGYREYNARDGGSPLVVHGPIGLTSGNHQSPSGMQWQGSPDIRQPGGIAPGLRCCHAGYMAAGGSPADQPRLTDHQPADQHAMGEPYEVRYEARKVSQVVPLLAGVPIAMTFGTFKALSIIVIAAMLLVGGGLTLRERDYRRGRTALRADAQGILLGHPWPASRARAARIPWPDVVAVRIQHRGTGNRLRRYLEVRRRNPAGPAGGGQPPVVVEPSMRRRLSAWRATRRRPDRLSVSSWQLDTSRLGEVMRYYAPHARLVEEPQPPGGGADPLT